MKKVIFLICSERSGSNLITQMINAHSQCIGRTPTHLFRLFITIEKNYGDLSIDTNWKRLLHDMCKAYQLKYGNDWAVEITADELFEQVSQRKATEVIKYIYTREAEIANKSITLIKEVKTYRLLPSLLINFPSAKFIFQTRDARDMVLSFKKSPIHRGEVIKATSIWREDQYYGLCALRMLEDRIFHLSYEALIENPEIILDNLCQFLDIPYEQEMLNFHSQKSTQKASASVDSWKNLDKSIMQNNSNKFEKELGEDEIKYIEYHCGAIMEELNYKRAFAPIDEMTYAQLLPIINSKENELKESFNLLDEVQKEKIKNWFAHYITLHPNRLFS